jgi:hypothetical protein
MSAHAFEVWGSAYKVFLVLAMNAQLSAQGEQGAVTGSNAGKSDG